MLTTNWTADRCISLPVSRWLCSIAGRTLVSAGKLFLSYARQLAGWVISLWLSRPLSVRQHDQLSLPSLRGRLKSSNPCYSGLRKQMAEGLVRGVAYRPRQRVLLATRLKCRLTAAGSRPSERRWVPLPCAAGCESPLAIGYFALPLLWLVSRTTRPSLCRSHQVSSLPIQVSIAGWDGLSTHQPIITLAQLARATASAQFRSCVEQHISRWTRSSHLLQSRPGKHLQSRLRKITQRHISP